MSRQIKTSIFPIHWGERLSSQKSDNAQTLPNKNLTTYHETEKQQADLLEQDIQKRTKRSGTHGRFLTRYND